MINGSGYKNALISGANNISSHRAQINALNIFPVPDGDTGTNMSMTIGAAVELLEKESPKNVCECASAAASAMFRSARGNSGAILSLLFKGIASGLDECEEIDGKKFADAFSVGVEMAYKAVDNPIEGTMLTVARMASEAGTAAVEMDNDPIIFLGAVCSAAHDALEKTPNMLPVLKKAGVVDAGGMGLCMIFDGMLSLLRDGVMIEAVREEETNVTFNSGLDDEFFRNAAAEFDGDIQYTYCTEFIVGKLYENVVLADAENELRALLKEIGDCVVVEPDELQCLLKAHIHTENPGAALEGAVKYGEILNVKIDNMKEQHRKLAEKYEREKAKAEEEERILEELKSAEPENDIGFVAVASGDGLHCVFKELGCDRIVNGGQSMNPSTDDIYRAVKATPAKTVFVLPNNKNIILAAEQVIPLVNDREVVIIPSKTIPQGIAAMLSYDKDSTAELNRDNMISSLSVVSTGQVTYAARNSEYGIMKIKEGDIIALNNGRLTIKEKDPVKAVVKLAKEMIGKDTSYVSLIYGEGITDEQASAAAEGIRAKTGIDADISIIDGGQPVYYFILSVE